MHVAAAIEGAITELEGDTGMYPKWLVRVFAVSLLVAAVALVTITATAVIDARGTMFASIGVLGVALIAISHVIGYAERHPTNQGHNSTSTID